MKKKEIFTLIFSLIIIVAAVYFGLVFLLPKKDNAAVLEQKKTNAVVPVQREFDQNTLNAVEKFEDYGKPQLDNLGKEDLFGGF